MSNMLIEIYFKVRCETKAKQNVRIVGDIFQLGQWNPQSGLNLNTNQDIYPIWQGVLKAQIKKNTLIQFKAVVIDDNQFFWEQNDNRAIQIRFLSQSVIFAFNGQFTKMIKIRSYSELDSESELDSNDISQVRQIQILDHEHPLDYEFISSDSGYESNEFSEMLQENILSKSKSLDQSDKESVKAISYLKISSFKI